MPPSSPVHADMDAVILKAKGEVLYREQGKHEFTSEHPCVSNVISVSILGARRVKPPRVENLAGTFVHRMSDDALEAYKVSMCAICLPSLLS